MVEKLLLLDTLRIISRRTPISDLNSAYPSSHESTEFVEDIGSRGGLEGNSGDGIRRGSDLILGNEGICEGARFSWALFYIKPFINHI